jgi:HK97 family phage major capsid protein
MGKPVLFSEATPQLGTAGDIILADLTQYLLIDKGGPGLLASMDLRFIEDETCFRFSWRIEGQPALSTPLMTANSPTSKSAFVALAARP